MANNTNDIQDISLAVTNKKSIRIDGDENRIIKLNTSDVGIISRLEDAQPKLDELANKASKELSEVENTENEDGELNTKVLGKVLKEIDGEMRGYIDFIFDDEVSSKCAPSGNMFDLFNGKFRFEHIIEVLGNLYADNIKKELKEFDKSRQVVNKKTSRYIPAKKTTPKRESK